MNAYERRRKARLAKQQMRRSARNFVKLLEIDSIQKLYEDAWFRLHGTRVRTSHCHGRYYALGRGYYQRDFLYQIDLLEASIHERELNVPEEN